MTLHIQRLIRFSTVGVVGTVVYYMLLWGMVEVYGLSVLLATSIAFLLVVAQNYVLHYGWTFASDNPHSSAVPRFLLMSVTGFCINWGVMYAGIRIIEVNYLISQAVAIAIVVIWNFSLSATWIFGNRYGRD